MKGRCSKSEWPDWLQEFLIPAIIDGSISHLCCIFRRARNKIPQKDIYWIKTLGKYVAFAAFVHSVRLCTIAKDTASFLDKPTSNTVPNIASKRILQILRMKLLLTFDKQLLQLLCIKFPKAELQNCYFGSKLLWPPYILQQMSLKYNIIEYWKYLSAKVILFFS